MEEALTYILVLYRKGEEYNKHEINKSQDKDWEETNLEKVVYCLGKRMGIDLEEVEDAREEIQKPFVQLLQKLQKEDRQHLVESPRQ